MKNSETYTRLDLSKFFPHDGSPVLDYIVIDQLAEYPVNTFSHTHSEINYCYSGEAQCVLESNRKRIIADDFYLVNPLEVHGNGTKDQCGFYILGISNVVFQITSGDRFFHTNGQYLKSIIEAIVYYATNDVPDQGIIIKHLFELVLDIIKSNLNMSGLIKIEQGPVDSLESIKNYIDSSFLQKIVVSELAEKFGFSESTIMHSFKKKYGVSIMRYIIDRRLQEAQFQLEILNDSIQKIASITGFSSLQYFHKCFKKKFGVTPQEYRTNYRKNDS